ncbi:MAG: hypothetical protein ABSA11_07470 [Candidatus Bathyarchaeia archaeon]
MVKSNNQSRSYTRRNLGSSKSDNYFIEYYKNIAKPKRGIVMSREEYLACCSFKTLHKQLCKLYHQKIDITERMDKLNIEIDSVIKIIEKNPNIPLYSMYTLKNEEWNMGESEVKVV